MGAAPMPAGQTEGGWTGPVPTTVHQGRGLAACAYLFTAVSGLVVLLMAKKDQRFARWHAVQAIALGFAAFLVAALLNLVNAALALAGRVNVFSRSAGLSIGMVAWLVAYILVVVLAVAALRGKTLRLPGLATVADRYA